VQLYYVRALNACGEYRAAITECQAAAQTSTKGKDTSELKRFWLEAAWAETYLGNLDAAREYLRLARKRARTSSSKRRRKNELPGKHLRARAQWIEARILRDQGDYVRALSLFEKVRAVYLAQDELFDAARLTREIAHAHTLTEPLKALPLLADAKQIFERANFQIEIGLCQLFVATAQLRLNRFQEALNQYAEARRIFVERGHLFFVADCDMGTGLTLLWLNRFEEALPRLLEARNYFARSGAEAEASSCDVSIGTVLSYLNRYEEAQARWEDAAQRAFVTGRDKKAALCFMNLGWVYDKQGRYAQALEHYQRARDEFVQEQMLARMILCDLNLGLTYGNLGQNKEALQVLDRARTLCLSQELPAHLANCELERARVFFRMGKRAEGFASLDRARTLFLETGQPVYVALCDVQLAQARTERTHKSDSLKRLRRSHDFFVAHGQWIDAALCDLTRGELHVVWREWEEARNYLERARRILKPTLPDHAWRAEYALAQVAQARQQPRAARRYYLTAIETITHVRAELGIERFSNDLFGAREFVFTDALQFMQQAGAKEDTLTILEAAKAQTFARYVTPHEWRVPLDGRAAKESRKLEQRERELRYQLAALRAKVSLQTAQGEGEPLRGADR